MPGTHSSVDWEGERGPGLVLTGVENLIPTDIDFRTVQPVASHYTNWAIAAQYLLDEFKTSKIRSQDKLGEWVIDHVAIFVCIQNAAAVLCYSYTYGMIFIT